MAHVQNLPSGNRYLLAETFRKWYGSTIFVSMEYAPFFRLEYVFVQSSPKKYPNFETYVSQESLKIPV